MSSAIDGAIADVLSTKRNKLVHPGDGVLSQSYATPREVSSILAEAVTHRGQYRVASNNLALGAQSNFILSTSAIIADPMLCLSLQAPTNAFFAYAGWGFDLIESIEITYSNSLMQNMVIRGEILKEYSKLCTCHRDELEEMLKTAGDNSTVAGALQNACVPLSFLNYNTSGMKGSWPTDASVLAGPIQISINWVTPAKVSRIFVNTEDAAGAMPSALASVEITCTTVTIQRAAFGVKDAMMRDRSLVYAIPSRYLSIVNESRTVLNAVTDKITINLNSAPSGMLEGILIYAAPNDVSENGSDWVSGGSEKKKYGGSLRVDNLRLQFGSQDLIRYKNRQEMLAFNRATFGKSLSYYEYANDPGAAAPSLERRETEIIFLPLVQNGCGVFNGHVNEHVPSYGGSQLQLEIQFSNVVGSISGPSPFGPESATDLVVATSVQIWVCYLISSILEISQGTVDLQL